jgi:hypothetical protein
MSIRGATDPPLWEPPVEQLSPEWWEMILFALQEADRLGLKIAMHLCDGFAVAGGPWITPELSMQKVVWSEVYVTGEQVFDAPLPQPETMEDYYRDIALFAIPVPEHSELSTRDVPVQVTTDKPGEDVRFLVSPGNEQVFRSDEPCRILFEFVDTFLCRSVIIRTRGSNYQAHRLLLEAGDDGAHFREICRFDAPRHGWQDGDAGVTHVIPPTKARYFRFEYNTDGSEPGAEDLDAAKWKPSLRITGIELSGAPRIHQYEGKSGAVWRVSKRTTPEQAPVDICIPAYRIQDISDHMDDHGHLTWDVPEGRWLILRMGHTSTGHTNATGGAGMGLECDKLNPEAVRIQFDHWFGEALRKAGPDLAGRVLTTLHVDSWECGSQNWSTFFPEEFRQRRGYELYGYLPVMAGIPVESAERSEEVLHDIRQTISELVNEHFYGTLSVLAGEAGCSVSSENVAPTFTSDGMLHFSQVDIPMGEFWLRSPTHDKRNDILDAISGAHIYGKPVIQAEAFTQLRMAWDEYPGMLRSLADRNLALGINRLVFHVFTHNPWTDRKPGMTLDGIGLYFQRDQTWWDAGQAWIKYLQRCQALLQLGVPVNDIAVFTGEEIPRRAVLPERLVPSLPGIFGPEKVKQEKIRMANEGIPLVEMPDGVLHSANMADHYDWTDPLKGYGYDSFNPDALLRLARVKDGYILLPGGARYKLLIIPGARSMSPAEGPLSPGAAEKLASLVSQGATVLFCGHPGMDEVTARNPEKTITAHDTLIYWKKGKGRIVQGPWTNGTFEIIGISPDLMALDNEGKWIDRIAWTHRTAIKLDIYFISNQLDAGRTINLSLRCSGMIPEIYDPLKGEIYRVERWEDDGNRTWLKLSLEANGSVFVVLRDKKLTEGKRYPFPVDEPVIISELSGPWQVIFSEKAGGPGQPLTFEQLSDWSASHMEEVRYYSGTASYTKTFQWDSDSLNRNRTWLDLGRVAGIAEVELNGIACGTAWTSPWRVEITGALQQGENKLVVKVTNTWANRLTGDNRPGEAERHTWTTAPYRLEGKPLQESGLLGPVMIMQGD